MPPKPSGRNGWSPTTWRARATSRIAWSRARTAPACAGLRPRQPCAPAGSVMRPGGGGASAGGRCLGGGAVRAGHVGGPAVSLVAHSPPRGTRAPRTRQRGRCDRALSAHAADSEAARISEAAVVHARRIRRVAAAQTAGRLRWASSLTPIMRCASAAMRARHPGCPCCSIAWNANSFRPAAVARQVPQQMPARRQLVGIDGSCASATRTLSKTSRRSSAKVALSSCGCEQARGRAGRRDQSQRGHDVAHRTAPSNINNSLSAPI